MISAYALPWTFAPEPDLSGFSDAPWPAVISVLLANRGASNTAAGQAMLGDPGPPTDPHLMPNLDRAADRLAQAATDAETIGVIGDYDVDGVTSTVILAEAMTSFGATIVPWLPDRFIDGYGPSERAVRYLHERGARVLITADCGTSAHTELALAGELGMDVIVLDHHSPPEHLPDVFALVNHKLPGCDYGSEPAACGISYKTMRAVRSRLDRTWRQAGEHLALAALGTVCDMVPLTGEQRDLVRHGLPRLQKTQRVGLRALAQHGGFAIEEADEQMCGWRLGPRLNAAGRMEHANLAYELLTSSGSGDAMQRAAQIEVLNNQRREITLTAANAALDEFHSRKDDPALAFVAGSDIHQGVAGLVAGRLAQSLRRPAIALHVTGDLAVGSMRSVGDFDCVAMLRRHEDLFERFGGHRAAAGCTIRTDRIDEARERLEADAAVTLTPQDRSIDYAVEAEMDPSELVGDTATGLERLAPFGIGHPKPVLLGRATRPVEQRAVGGDRQHLALVFAGGVRGIAFGYGALAGAFTSADVIYHPMRDQRSGRLEAEIIEMGSLE